MRDVIGRLLSACLLSTSLLAATLTTSPARAEDFKIGYSVFWGTNPFLVTMVNGAKKAAEEWKAKGVNVDMIVTNGGDTDKAKQVADLEDLYAQGVNGVLIFPGDSVMVAEPIKNIYNAEKIPVVITDIGVRSGEYISLIITDNYKGGAAGRRLHGDAGAEGRQGHHARPRADQRQRPDPPEGFRGPRQGARPRRAARAAGCRALTLDAGRQAMEDLLVSEPDIKGAFAFNQLVIQGAYQALEQAGKTDDVKLVGFDLDPVSFKMVADGKIDALVVQDPYRMGYDGMNTVLTNLTGGEVEEFVGLGTKLLTKENAAEFANDPQVTGK